MRTLMWLLCLSAAVSLNAQTTSGPPSIVLLHGKVFTADPQKRWAEAVAMRGERIVAVGTNAEIAALATDKTKQYDVGGRVVIPGINDAHTHQSPLPAHFQISTSRDPTWEEVSLAVGSAVEESPGDFWVLGDIGPTLLRDPQATSGAL